MFGGETNKANGEYERKGTVGQHKDGHKGGDKWRGRYNWQMDRNLLHKVMYIVKISRLNIIVGHEVHYNFFTDFVINCNYYLQVLDWILPCTTPWVVRI